MYGVRPHHILIIVALVIAGILLWFLVFAERAL
jgi:hypothetical protein